MRGSRLLKRIISDQSYWFEAAAERSPLRRAINRQEVADAVLYLSSPFASAITGQVLYVDCGYHAMGV